MRQGKSKSQLFDLISFPKWCRATWRLAFGRDHTLWRSSRLFPGSSGSPGVCREGAYVPASAHLSFLPENITKCLYCSVPDTQPQVACLAPGRFSVLFPDCSVCSSSLDEERSSGALRGPHPAVNLRTPPPPSEAAGMRVAQHRGAWPQRGMLETAAPAWTPRCREFSCCLSLRKDTSREALGTGSLPALAVIFGRQISGAGLEWFDSNSSCVPLAS